MQLREIKYRNLLRLCRENNCEEPSRLAVLLGSKIQHAQQLLKGKSSIGNSTINKLCSAWKISPEEFIRIDQPEKKQPVPTSQEIPWSMQTIIDSIRDDIKAINSRMDAQGNALQGLQDDCLEVKNEIHEIYKRMYEAADTKDIGRLKKVG